MAKDFSKTSIEYNEGFIDGLLWVLNSGNKTGLNEIISMVEDIRKANDKKLDDEEKRFEQMKINLSRGNGFETLYKRYKELTSDDE